MAAATATIPTVDHDHRTWRRMARASPRYTRKIVPCTGPITSTRTPSPNACLPIDAASSTRYEMASTMATPRNQRITPSIMVAPPPAAKLAGRRPHAVGRDVASAAADVAAVAEALGIDRFEVMGHSDAVARGNGASRGRSMVYAAAILVVATVVAVVKN